jgi:hypothetical protein
MLLSKSNAGYFNFCSFGDKRYKKAWIDGKPGIESP